METSIKMSDAIAILQKRYEREYSMYEDVKVEFDVESRDVLSEGYGGDSIRYTIHELRSTIIYYTKFGDLKIKNKKTRKGIELTKDLINELNTMNKNEDCYVSDAYMPTILNSNKIDEEQEVKLYFRKKDQEKVKHLSK